MTQSAGSPRRRDEPLITYANPRETSLRSWLVDRIERLTGRDELEAIYRQLKIEAQPIERVFSRALELASIQYRTQGAELPPVPQQGPLVVVANHPFGVVDGLILCDIAARLRGEFRILINAQLCRDSDFDDWFLPIEFDSSKSALATNIATRRSALRTLGDGGVILVFPAGGISTRGSFGFGDLREFPWRTFCAKLIHASKASVLPVFFHGANSRLFHVFSTISPVLRASLLLHEARNKIGRCFIVTVGNAVAYEQLQHLDRSAMTARLQAMTRDLGCASGVSCESGAK